MSKKRKDKSSPVAVGSTPNPPEISPAHLQKVVGIEKVTTHFSGPLPPPDILKRYNDIVSGAAERILVMAEKQSMHRQDLEKKLVYGNVNHDLLGMILGFIVCILLISAGTFLVYADKPITGFVSMLSGVALIVGAFLQRSYERKQEKKRKRKQEKKDDKSKSDVKVTI